MKPELEHRGYEPGDRRLRGATRAQIERATDALFDIRQTHLGEFADD